MNPVRDFVAFDLETTGLDRETDCIIEIGAVRVRGSIAEARMARLAKPTRPLSPMAEALTGITEGMLAEAGPLAEGLREFLAFAEGLPLVAHNADFDAAFLSQALQAEGLGPLANPVFDSLLLARAAWPVFDSHRLESLVEALGIPPQTAHRALPDAEQAAQVWLRAQERLADLSPVTRAAFAHVLQAGPEPWRSLFGGGETGRTDATDATDATGTDGKMGGAGFEPAAVLRQAMTAPQPDTAGGLDQSDAAGSAESAAKTTTNHEISAADPAAANAADPRAAVTGGFAKPTATAESIFSGGAAARAFASLGRPYREGSRQARLAGLAERALQEGRILAVDADPGSGRALACLAAALRHGKLRRRPAVFAVSGRPRLERIEERDLPALRALYPDARIEILKAPSSYPSPRKLAAILEHPDTRLTDEERLALLPLLAWLERPGRGDIAANSGFNHERHRALWSKLAAENYAAEPDGWAFAARERAKRSHVIIVTHDLLLDDLALDFALLPTYEALIVDEAHRLPEAGRLRLGREAGYFRLKHIVQAIAQGKQDPRGLLAELERGAGIAPAAPDPESSVSAEGPLTPEAQEAPEATETTGAAGAGETGNDPAPDDAPEAGAAETASPAAARPEAEAARPSAEPDPLADVRALRRLAFEPERQLQKFFNKMARQAQKRRKDGESRIRYADKLVVEFNAGPEHVTAALAALEGTLRRLESFRPDLAPDLRRTADLLREYRGDLEHLAHPAGADETFWIEDFPNPHRALLRCAPVSFGPAFAEKLLSQMEAAVLVSPALSVGDDFSFFLRQCGLDPRPERLKTALVRGRGPAEALAPVHIARFVPVLSGGNALQAHCDFLSRRLADDPRPALILFTHIGLLKQARALLSESLAPRGRLVLAQHVDGSRENLLHMFRRRPGVCLLATEAFLENLEPGEALPEWVAVAKLPFPVPGEPLVAPHLERLQEQGRNPLHEYLLPAAILRLKFELNRLPGSGASRPEIWILDPRLATEKYARTFQRGLGREAIVVARDGEPDAKAEKAEKAAAVIDEGDPRGRAGAAPPDRSAPPSESDSQIPPPA